MRSLRILVPALMLGTCLSGVALAVEESIIVTATRLPKNALTSASISTLTEEDLARRQDAFLVDALTALPGVAVSQNGPFGGQAALRLRGTSSEQTLVMIDGVVVNDTTSPGGGFNYATLDSADIERVDVLHGPQSTLWGSDAIGGVVSIVTKRPERGFGIGGFVEGGSFATARGQLAIWGKSGAIDGRLSVGAIGTDGISKADVRDGNTETDPYHSWTAHGRIGVDLGENARVEFFGRYTDSTSHYDGFGFVTGAADSDDSSSSQESITGIVGRFDMFDGRLQNLVQISQTEVERADTSGGFSFLRLGWRADRLPLSGHARCDGQRHCGVRRRVRAEPLLRCVPHRSWHRHDGHLCAGRMVADRNADDQRRHT
jgi:vitamin B12 transporter